MKLTGFKYLLIDNINVVMKVIKAPITWFFEMWSALLIMFYCINNHNKLSFTFYFP